MNARLMMNNMEALVEIYTMKGGSPETILSHARRTTELMEELIARGCGEEGTIIAFTFLLHHDHLHRHLHVMFSGARGALADPRACASGQRTGRRSIQGPQTSIRPQQEAPHGRESLRDQEQTVPGVGRRLSMINM